MKNLSATAALVAVFALSVTPAARSAHQESVVITNKSGYAVWVTTYKAPDRRDGIVKAQCFVPDQSNPQKSTSKGGWVLFEIKASRTSCAEHGNMKVYERNVNNHATINLGGISAN